MHGWFIFGCDRVRVCWNVFDQRFRSAIWRVLGCGFLTDQLYDWSRDSNCFLVANDCSVDYAISADSVGICHNIW